MVRPTAPRENRKMLALPEDQIFISILCVSALIPGGCLVQCLQQSSDVKAVGTENQTEKQLVQHHCYSRREKLLEKKTEVPSGEFLM